MNIANECPPDWAQLDALREDFEYALGAYMEG